MKTVLKIAIAGVALAAMSWCGLFVYWHLKISQAIRQLQTDTAVPTPPLGAEADLFRRRPESFTFLRVAAGCRALPYLVAALNPQESPEFLESVAFLIAQQVDNPELIESSKSPRRLKFHWPISPHDSLEQRTKNCDQIREYWRENGRQHHQTWRIWTDRCGE
jgi:hypothetical protein